MDGEFGRAPKGELNLNHALGAANCRLARAWITQRALKSAVLPIGELEQGTDVFVVAVLGGGVAGRGQERGPDSSVQHGVRMFATKLHFRAQVVCCRDGVLKCHLVEAEIDPLDALRRHATHRPLDKLRAIDASL